MTQRDQRQLRLARLWQFITAAVALGLACASIVNLAGWIFTWEATGGSDGAGEVFLQIMALVSLASLVACLDRFSKEISG